MKKIATIISNARSLRALGAVAMIVALGAMFIFHQREMQGAKDRAMFAVSATGWKVSELIIESLRFNQSLRMHASGEQSRSDLQLRFDILWSRIDVVANTDIDQDPTLAAAIETYRDYVEGFDPVVFGDGLIPPRVAVAKAKEVSELSNQMRVAWVNAFAGRQFADASLAIIEREEGLRRQTLIAMLIGLIGVYLVAEIFLAGAAQKKEAQLEAEATAAAMASAAKTRFLANVSHEIRTPLNGILGMAAELEETRLNADQRSCLKVISHAGDVLLHTLNDVLDLSKVESGELELEHIDFDLHGLVESAVALYRPRAEEKSLSLTLTKGDDLPSWVTGDGRRISQVLHNLIGNAIKFTEQGQIDVHVAPAPAHGYIRFSVKDTGTGIDPAVHERIFQPFSQADGSITRKKGGTGLGLSISRNLCDSMGGYLNLDSKLGHGAVFWFDLPLPVSQEVEGRRPVAVDLVAPPPRGLEAEVDPEDLNAPVARASDAVPAAHDGEFRILIVDDNATNRMLLRRFLKDQTVDISEASDGSKAVEAVRCQNFDLIFMDIQMPIMDGIQATQHIRRYEKETTGQATKIVAVTANVMTHQVEEYRENGVDDVLGKPVSKRAVLSFLPSQGKDAA